MTTTTRIAECKAATSAARSLIRHLTALHATALVGMVESIIRTLDGLRTESAQPTSAPAPTAKATPPAVAPVQTPAPAAIPDDTRLAMLTTPALVAIAKANGMDTTDEKGQALSGRKLCFALSVARSKAAASAPTAPVNPNVTVPTPVTPAPKPATPAPAATATLLTAAAIAAMSGAEVAAQCVKHGIPGGSVDTLRERLIAKLGLTASAPAPAASKAKCHGTANDGKPCNNPPVAGSAGCRHHPVKPTAPVAAQTTVPTAKLAPIPDDATLEKLTQAQLVALFARLEVRTQRLILAAAR